MHDVAYTHCQCATGYVVDVGKHTSIVANCAFGKFDDVRVAVKRCVGLVKTDVSVTTDAEDLNVLRMLLDKGGVACALLFGIGGKSVGNMGVFAIDVDVIEEVVRHKVNVALVAVFPQTDVFVKVYAAYVCKTKLLFVAVVGKNFVHAYGRAARCKTQHGVRIAFYHVGNKFRRNLAHLVVVVNNNDFHL